MTDRPPIIARTDPALLAVARGDAPADLVLTNARVVDVFTRQIIQASVSIFGGRFAGVGEALDARQRIDLEGRYICPGFIDAHMHCESTCMLPGQFVRVALPHGTTGVVFDPHEIANVLGIPGIRLMMDESQGLPMNIMFAASSCVPSSPLETSGASLSAADLAPLFEEDRVVALAEMMNFPGVVHADPEVLSKVRLGLVSRIVDGHSPGLSGKPLQAYVAAGISSDHECTTAAEALEKIRLGMQVYIREGSAARNLEALIPAVTSDNAHRFCLCTDDRHPGDLAHQGHIDHVVRLAIDAGLDAPTAIAMGSLHAADHYRQGDLGAIAPGRLADLIIFDDLADLKPMSVYVHGNLVARDGRMLDTEPEKPDSARRQIALNSVTLPAGLSAESFAIPMRNPGARVRVIVADPHQLVTEERIVEPTIRDGHCVADPARDLLKLCVIERHGRRGTIGRGLVTGFGLGRGALASTVGHDAHNLAVVGTNDQDMFMAAQTLADCGGGQCVVQGSTVKAVFELPIAGLMSDKPAEQVIAEQAALLAATRSIGCAFEDPFMPLSFLTLPVIPKLKLTDLGLVDVDLFEIVPLAVEEGKSP